MHHHYWACALEPGSRNSWAHIPQLPQPKDPGAHAQQQEKPLQWEAFALQLETLAATAEKPVRQQRPSTAKNKWLFLKDKEKGEKEEGKKERKEGKKDSKNPPSQCKRIILIASLSSASRQVPSTNLSSKIFKGPSAVCPDHRISRALARKGLGGNPYGLAVSLPYRYSDITAFS